MNYLELEKHLFDIADKKFADFSKTLSNSDYRVIGVKNPILRKLIKEHKDDKELSLDEFTLGEYLEIDFIYFGLALTRLNNVDKQLEFLEENIHFAKSWAITDCVSTYIKKCTFGKYWRFFLDLYDSKFTYDRRMAYIIGLKFYKDKDILIVLNHLILNEEYMVMMAEAWLLATVAITHPKEIYEYLSNCPDIKLKRKAISKISDSYRFDIDTKNMFKSLR